MRKTMNSNMRVEVVTDGKLKFFITTHFVYEPVISINLPYLKPDGEYASSSCSDFTDEEEIRFIMYETPNKFLNKLFSYLEYHNYCNMPGEYPIDAFFSIDQIDYFLKLYADHFEVCLSDYESEPRIRFDYNVEERKFMTMIKLLRAAKPAL